MSNLSAFLTSKQIRQQDFAERIGVTQATVSRLAKRTMMPSLPLAVEIERATDGEVPVSSWVNDDPAQPDGDFSSEEVS